MGLIFCSECGRRISDEAESCPHCGVPVRHKNRQLGKIEKQEKSGDKNYALVVIGYLICLFSFLIYPVLLGVGGVVFGILNIANRETKHGVIQVMIAVISLAVEFSYDHYGYWL